MCVVSGNCRAMSTAPHPLRPVNSTNARAPMPINSENTPVNGPTIMGFADGKVFR